MTDFSVGSDFNTSAGNYGIGPLNGSDFGGFNLGSFFSNPGLMAGLGAGLGFLGFRDNSKQIDKMNQLLRQQYNLALNELRGAIGAAEQKELAAQGQFRAAASAAKVGAADAKRSTVAAQARAEDQAYRQGAALRSQAASNLIMRGLASSSAGAGLMASASNQAAQSGAQASIQGGMQRAQIGQALGGQIAQIRGNSASAYMAGANRTMQGGQALAQLIGSYSPIMDTGKGDFLSNLGGVAFGLGMENLLA